MENMRKNVVWRGVLVGCFLGLACGAQASADSVDVVEYYNQASGHYFITAHANEAEGIDAGAAGSDWGRTGFSFRGWVPGDFPEDATEVCRFWSDAYQSHFYTFVGNECEQVKENPFWTYEEQSKFYMKAPNQDGTCDADFDPVYRLYNNRQDYNDGNHRYTIDLDEYERMAELGWSQEGVRFCSPQEVDPLVGAYPIVDTGQDRCYDNNGVPMTCPGSDASLHGQDAQYEGNFPSYEVHGDGTVTDQVTGLMWQQAVGDKLTYAEAQTAAASFALAGYDDWRLPTIQELYSLINFNGITGSTEEDSTPYLDTSVFDFRYGDTSQGERMIDAQFVTSTEYVGTTMNGDATVFGVNFADGRIKGYPITDPITRTGKTFYVRYVRGNAYGGNVFTDDGDGTISDAATGLMWLEQDSGGLLGGPDGDGKLNWPEALAWCESLIYAGYDDWRLPNAKELHSIVDYSRAPDITGSPAIDPIFQTSSLVDGNGAVNYPFFWTNTSHLDGTGNYAVYIAFGEAQGYMVQEGSGQYSLLDVHGAGAQRSDPKTGNPEDYPYGNGPQGDVIGIYNFARCVR